SPPPGGGSWVSGGGCEPPVGGCEPPEGGVVLVGPLGVEGPPEGVVGSAAGDSSPDVGVSAGATGRCSPGCSPVDGGGALGRTSAGAGGALGSLIFWPALPLSAELIARTDEITTIATNSAAAPASTAERPEPASAPRSPPPRPAAPGGSVSPDRHCAGGVPSPLRASVSAGSAPSLSGACGSSGSCASSGSCGSCAAIRWKAAASAGASGSRKTVPSS